MIVRDLDGDGRNDLFLHHEWIQCSSGSAITCGKVCEINIYLRRGQLLKKFATYAGLGSKFDSQVPPTIKTQGFRLQDVYTRWTGEKFENVSKSSFEEERDFLASFFEGQNCIATESELFEFFVGRTGGRGAANRAVIATSERDDVHVLSTKPYTYQFSGSTFCAIVSGSGGGSAAAEDEIAYGALRPTGKMDRVCKGRNRQRQPAKERGCGICCILCQTKEPTRILGRA